MRSHLAAVVLFLVGCAAPPSRAPALPSPEPSAPAPPAEPPPASTPFERSKDACGTSEGDPRTWRAQATIDDPDHTWCAWTVVRTPAGIRAKLDLALEPPKPLPFVPSDPPRRQVVRCQAACSTPHPPDAPLDVRDYLEVDGGYLVGFNSGEWGGGIVYYDAVGRRQQSLTDEHAIRLLPIPGGVLALTGFAHMFTDRGQVMRLSRAGGAWRARSTPLPGEPRAIVVTPDGSILAVTTRFLVRITEGPRVELLHEGHFWDATSIAPDVDGTLYVGRTSAVVRLRSTEAGYVEEWLAPYEIAERKPEPGEG